MGPRERRYSRVEGKARRRLTAEVPHSGGHRLKPVPLGGERPASESGRYKCIGTGRGKLRKGTSKQGRLTYVQQKG